MANWSSFVLAIRPEANDAPTAPSGDDLAELEAHVRLAGEWVDIGESGIYRRVPVKLRFGRSDWSKQAEPSSCRLTLDNRQGQWSTDYSSAPRHGRFGRNVELRVGRSQPDAFLEFVENIEPSYASTAYVTQANLNITGDIDIRWEMEPWRDLRVGERAIIAQVNGAWKLFMERANQTTPYLRLEWVDSVGNEDSYTYLSGEDLDWSWMWLRQAYRVTLDVSTGGVSWYTSDSIGGSWTLLGSEDTSNGATDIVTSTGALNLLSGAPWDGGTTDYSIAPIRLYNFEVYDGIAGTNRLDVDFTSETPGSSSVTPDTGSAITINTNGRVTKTRWRFHGEIAALPTKFALSGNDQWVPVEANGLLRRLRQGDKVLASPIRRAYDREQVSAKVVQYWPMEEKGDQYTKSFGAVIGTEPLRLQSGEPNPSSNNDFLASDDIPTLADDVWVGEVDQVASPGEWMFRCLLSVPENWNDTEVLFQVETGDVTWTLTIDTTSALQVKGYRDGVLTHTGSNWAFSIEDIPVRLSLEFEQDGADVDMTISATDVDSTVTGGGTDAFSSADVSFPTRVTLNPDGAAADIALGHITIESETRSGDLLDDITARQGETAAARILRLCNEEGLVSRISGDPTDSVKMGPQRLKPLVELLEECAATDLGILFDPQEVLGVGYRTGASMRNQSATIDVDYSAGDADGTLDLTKDDQVLFNDVTVKNWDGSTSRAELGTGILGTQEPPTGAGRYDTSYTVNVDNPAHLKGHAFARLDLSTLTEPRLAKLAFALHSGTVSTAEQRQILTARPGDKIGLTNLPSTIHPEDLDQIIQGWSETIDTHKHTIVMNTTPATPWDTGIVESATLRARYDTRSSVLASGEDSGQSVIFVETTSGAIWTTDPDDFPFDILCDGIRLTVNSISGTGSVQTFTLAGTLVRDVEGGREVTLADPTVWSL